MTSRSATQTLASFASRVTFEDLPPQVVHKAKQVILDMVGCALGGYSHDIGNLSRNFVTSLGGTPESVVVGSGEKTSCTNAAFVNGNMANAIDFDDNFMNLGHPAAPLVWAAIPLGERERVSGRDLITAAVVGYDIAARVGVSTEFPGILEGGVLKRRPVYSLSWHAFGAVAGGGKILRLDEEQMAHAFGILGLLAPMPALGAWSQHTEGLSLMKYISQGWASQGGVTAALLAKAGYTGNTTILDGDLGFWRMEGNAECDFDYMVSELGGKWWIMESAVKPWPCCRHAHPPLTAFTELIRKYNLKPEEIDEVLIKAREVTWFAMVHPKARVDGQWSAPYCFANAAYNITPGPQWHYPERMNDPLLRRFREKVKIETDPKTVEVLKEQVTGKPPKRVKRTPTTVEVKARGQLFTHSVEYAKGDPWVPETVMSDQELKEKFTANAIDVAAGSAVWRQKISQVIEMIYDLEKVRDITELTTLLAP